MPPKAQGPKARPVSPPATQGGSVTTHTNLLNDARTESSNALDDYVNAEPRLPSTTYRDIWRGLQGDIQAKNDHDELMNEIEKGKDLIADAEAVQQAQENLRFLSTYNNRDDELYKDLEKAVTDAARKIPGFGSKVQGVLTTDLSQQMARMKTDYEKVIRNLASQADRLKILTANLKEQKASYIELRQETTKAQIDYNLETSRLHFEISRLEQQQVDTQHSTEREQGLRERINELEQELGKARIRLNVDSDNVWLQELGQELNEEALDTFRSSEAARDINLNEVGVAQVYFLFGRYWTLREKMEDRWRGLHDIIEELEKEKESWERQLEVEQQKVQMSAEQQQLTAVDLRIMKRVLTLIICSPGITFGTLQTIMNDEPRWPIIADIQIGAKKHLLRAELQSYLEILSKSDQEHTELKTQATGEQQRVNSAVQSTITTWEERFRRRERELLAEAEEKDKQRKRAVDSSGNAQRQVNDLTQKLTQAESEIQRLTTDDTRMQNLRTELQEARTDINSKATQIESLRNEAAKVEPLQQARNNEREGRVTAENTIQTLQNRVDELKQNIETVIEERDSIQKQISELQGGDLSHDQLVRTLNESIKSLQDFKAKQEEDLAKLRADHSNCEKERSRMAGRQEATDNQLQENGRSIEKLKQIEQIYFTAKRDLESSNNEIERLNKSLSELKVDFGEAQAAIKKEANEVDAWIDTTFAHLLNKEKAEYNESRQLISMAKIHSIKETLMRPSSDIITLLESEPVADSMLLLLRIWSDCISITRSPPLSMVNQFLHNLPTNLEDLKFCVALLGDGVKRQWWSMMHLSYTEDVALRQLYRFVKDRDVHYDLDIDAGSGLLQDVLPRKDVLQSIQQDPYTFQAGDYHFNYDDPCMIVIVGSNLIVLEPKDFAVKNQGLTWEIFFNVGGKTRSVMVSAGKRSAIKAIQKMDPVLERMRNGNTEFLKMQ